MPNRVFADNLRKYRKRKGLTQAALGDQAGYAQGHISNLERGAIAPSLAVLEQLASVLGVTTADLLAADLGETTDSPVREGVPIINERSRTKLVAPQLKRGRVLGDSGKAFCHPDCRGEALFAAFLPDGSMAPEFGKGDLVTFSLSRKPADGDACLVDTGKGQVLFRTVWAVGKGRWRLQASNPRYEPMVVKGSKRLKMWPAVGHWRMLVGHRKR